MVAARTKRTRKPSHEGDGLVAPSNALTESVNFPDLGSGNSVFDCLGDLLRRPLPKTLSELRSGRTEAMAAQRSERLIVFPQVCE